MATYNPEFNQIQAPQIQPQLNPGRVDVGISQVSAEFSRQEAGLRSNLQQMRENEAAMQRSMKTQMDRSAMDWKNYEKLAQFSSTLSDQLVENQEEENKRIMLENMNQAMIEGADPHAQAKYDEEVQQLADANKVAVGVATEYKNRGGLPDVAYEIERRSGWAAYGYAVGVAQNGGKNYGAFLEANKETAIGQRADGSPISLASARNSAEYQAAMKVLRNEYWAPYAGLNPNLLNEHLIDPMRQEEDVQFAQWEKDFAANKEKERDLEIMGGLVAVKDNPLKAANLLEDNIQTEAIRNGGNLRLARQTELARLTRLGERGMIPPGQMQEILEVEIPMKGGKRRLIDTPEGKAALAAAEKYQTQQFTRKETQLREKRVNLVRRTSELVQKEGYLDADTRAAFINDYVQAGGDPVEAETLFPTRDKAVSDAAAEQINQLINAGAYVPEGLINQLDETKRSLAVDARKRNEARRVNMGLTEVNAKSVKKTIKGLADEFAGTIGTSAESSPESNSAQRRALEWSQSWLQKNEGRYKTEGEMVEALELALKEQFGGLERTNSEGQEVTGYDASPFNSANVPDPEKGQQAFRENAVISQQHIATLAADGVRNPYAVGAIPGTEAELKKLKEHVEKDGTIPNVNNYPIYKQLVNQSNGTATWEQIAKSQLKAVYDIDFNLQYGPPAIEVLEGKDGVQIEEYREMRRLLSVNPTPNTTMRAGIDYTMMSNASQQGALSDPSNPNSPRIGEWVGGDQGSTQETGQGGQYTLNIQAVPGGFGPTIQKAADTYDIPADILAGLIEQESNFNPSAYNPSGATGIAQIIKRWHPESNPGVNPHDDIMYAAKYLRQLMDNEAKGDLRTAIYMYNAGPGTVLRYGVGASKENRDYYPGIMEKAKKYRRRSYGPVRPKYQAYVSDSPYNSPDLLSPNLRGRIYQLA